MCPPARANFPRVTLCLWLLGLSGCSSGAESGGAAPGVAGTGNGAQVTGGTGTDQPGKLATGGTPPLAGTAGTDAGGGGAMAGGGGGSVAQAGGPPADSVPLDPTLLTKCSGTSPIVCTLPAANGNYDVSVEVGDAAGPASSLVSAETRHYAADVVDSALGQFSLLTFTVNVRHEVHDGQQSAPADLLDLLVGGAAPKLHGLGLRAAPSSLTIFVAGDSTVCDWTATNTSAVRADETGWAQPLSRYFKQGVAVANYADSGETAAGFYTKFFPAARSAMKAGDYLFIQFGHNDQKPENNVAAAYQANLMKYVKDARDRNVTPVLFTPVSRKGGSTADPGFAGLDQEARDLANQEGIALIDLTLLSRAYYASVPDKNELFADGGTHLGEVGAIGVAGLVASQIKASELPLKAFVR